MEAAKIWIVTVIATVTYGIAQDLVTTRVSLEYFTIGHVNLFGIQSPAMLAFYWGIVATWWLGVPLGCLIALTARLGKRPKIAVRDLLRPGLCLLLAVGMLALLAGMAGYIAAELGVISLSAGFAEYIPPNGHHRFLAVAWAHTAAYGGGFIGATLLAAWIWTTRAKTPTPVLSRDLPRPIALDQKTA